MALDTELQSSSNHFIVQSNEEPTQSIDYETEYNKILNEHVQLKTKFSLQEKELLSAKESCISYININKSLRSQVNIFQKNFNDSNSI